MNADHEPTPWQAVRHLSPDCCRELRHRAIFQCCKWDPQVEDVDTLSPLAVVLKRSAWRELSSAAESLARETLILERALGERPDLHRALAIPRPIRRVLGQKSSHSDDVRHVRVMRFDFHPTFEGWRVSEVNSDVPGGYIEASGWTALVTEHVPEAEPAGDPAGKLADEFSRVVRPGDAIALVHATGYTDDHQVMRFLARRLQQRGLQPVLVAPDHLGWENDLAVVRTSWFTGPARFVFRFFPAEWLPNLGSSAAWPCFFAGSKTPLCNPATALLTQSKRWPLLLSELGLSLPAWQELLPETRDPRQVVWEGDPGWVIKPALGRVGESLGLHGVTCRPDWKAIRRSVRWGARHWVAQRRFYPIPIRIGGEEWHICFGVYTVNGRAAGIYGRVAPQPLINHLARDVAVLVEQVHTLPGPAHHCKSYELLGTV